MNLLLFPLNAIVYYCKFNLILAEFNLLNQTKTRLKNQETAY